MELIYTKRFLKQQKKLKTQRSIDDTDEVLKVMNDAKDFHELHEKLDIKKYDIDGSYRVRYSNKPEMRIRFILIKGKNQPQKIQLELVMTREDYGDWDTRVITEENNNKLLVILTEHQFNYLINSAEKIF